MRLPRYAEYKDSGADWLGSVPAQWSVGRLKTRVKLVTEKATRRTRPVALENIEGWSGRFIPTEGEFEGDGVAFAAGDVLFGKLRPYLAKAFLADSSGEAVGDFHVLRSNGTMNPRYLQYQVLNKAFIEVIDGSTFGSKMPRASWESLGNMPLALPSPDEQTAIAAFLDRETAKIDSLIAEQEKLIALLAEKRQATISYAVTKGLNSNAPMKDSGVAWLGKVPAHWRMLRVKALSRFTTSGPRGWSERITDDGSLFIQSGDLNESLGIEFETAKRVSVDDDAEATRTRLAEGDVVVCITGAKTGKVALCSSLTEPAYVNQHLCLIRPAEGVHGVFLALALKSDIGRTQLELSQYGLKQGLSLENVRELWVALPPSDEQAAIEAFVETEVGKLTSLALAADAGVGLLKQRRSALIAAAVAGQIDVRHA